MSNIFDYSPDITSNTIKVVGAVATAVSRKISFEITKPSRIRFYGSIAVSGNSPIAITIVTGTFATKTGGTPIIAKSSNPFETGLNKKVLEADISINDVVTSFTTPTIIRTQIVDIVPTNQANITLTDILNSDVMLLPGKYYMEITSPAVTGVGYTMNINAKIWGL